MQPPPGDDGARGLADQDPRVLGDRVLAAWDAFVELAAQADLDRPSRLPGWTGHDVCAHLGEWDGPEGGTLARVVASARAGGTGPVPDPDEGNARVVEAHRGASREELLDALRAARDGVATFLASGLVAEVGREPAVSSVGRLPVLGLLHAGTYELAVHALDLVPCGAPGPPAALLNAGLGSLVDVTGALAAARGIAMTLTAQTPDGGWSFTTAPPGWSTTALPTGPVQGTGVQGEARHLLDASAGRAHVPALLLSRKMVVHSMPSWLQLAPLIEDVPGLPGGAALKTAVSGLGGVGRLAARLPGLRGRR